MKTLPRGPTEVLLEVYGQARFACRYHGVDQSKFDEAMRGLWEATGEAQKLVEQGVFDAAPAVPDKVAELEALVKDFSQIAGNLQKELSRLRPVVGAALEFIDAEKECDALIDGTVKWDAGKHSLSIEKARDKYKALQGAVSSFRKADRGE